MSRNVQDLANRGITQNVTLLHEIDIYCANLYNYVQSHLTQTNSSSYDSLVIEPPILKRNMIPKYMQFSDWMKNMSSTLEESTTFDEFNPFS